MKREKDKSFHISPFTFHDCGGFMQVFFHLIYEYQKGLRDLCLFTCLTDLQEKIEQTLSRQNINYLICPIENKKINVFFGMKECLEIITQFSCSELNKLSTEEDFILGMMLGYAKPQQYQRFLTRKKMSQKQTINKEKYLTIA